MSIDDFIAILGFISLLSGIYLWLGLPASLIMLGVVLIYTGARMQPRSSNNESN